jgi:hypothetical protein
MSEEKCDRCGEVGQDRRTLWMACLYKMSELGLPFEEIAVRGHSRLYKSDDEVSAFVNEDLGAPPKQILNRFYLLTVCKDCRADWMNAIKRWFKEKPDREGTGTGVWVRDNGTNREATPAEVEDMIRRKSSEPHESPER